MNNYNWVTATKTWTTTYPWTTEYYDCGIWKANKEIARVLQKEAEKTLGIKIKNTETQKNKEGKKDMLKIIHVNVKKEKRVTVDKTKRDENGNYLVHKEYVPVATIVAFENGSQQVAYCDEGDEFNLEVGISICVTRELMQRLYGICGATNEYNKIIRNGLNVYKKEQKEIKKGVEIAKRMASIKKNKKEKEQRRRIKRAEKKKEREIEIMAEAIRRANVSKSADNVTCDDCKNIMCDDRK